ncbi:uncharacterized protein [Epargyreus clarus]|uniref:uncharacterized protein n=1 Tax=Epargyreus clarus TaxID=520877 RepID=UPI003C2FB3BF
MVAEQEKLMKVPPPGQFSFVPEEWPKYKRRFLRYIALSGHAEYTDQNKIDCLLYCMGEKAEDIIIQFEEKLSYDKLIEKFDTFFSPKKNVIYERYKFNARVQKEGEKFDEFITDLHKIAENCKYGTLKEELIRDRIVTGIYDKNVSDRMLLKNDLTLEEATLMGKQTEIQKEECKVMREKEEVINVIKEDTYRKKTQKCWFCGLQRHPRDKCPAYKVTCHKCQRVGHFARFCRGKSVRNVEKCDKTEYEEQI